MVYGHGYLHYGYWQDGEADEISFKRLGEAQEEYFNQLASLIPPDTKTILDVGSGTGSNANSLLRKGYSVDCVCPSSRLNQLAKTKLPPESSLYECFFEDFSSEKVYDLLLFSESFHYLNCEKAMDQIKKYAQKYVIIFDYFPLKDSAAADRLSYQQFSSLYTDRLSDTFEIVSDKNVTQNIIPTFKVLDEIKNQQVNPFLIKVVENYRKSHPVYSFFLSPLLNKKLKGFNKKSDRFHTFPAKFEYRLMLLSRKTLN